LSTREFYKDPKIFEWSLNYKLGTSKFVQDGIFIDELQGQKIETQ